MFWLIKNKHSVYYAKFTVIVIHGREVLALYQPVGTSAQTQFFLLCYMSFCDWEQQSLGVTSRGRRAHRHILHSSLTASINVNVVACNAVTFVLHKHKNQLRTMFNRKCLLTVTLCIMLLFFVHTILICSYAISWCIFVSPQKLHINKLVFLTSCIHSMCTGNVIHCTASIVLWWRHIYWWNVTR